MSSSRCHFAVCRNSARVLVDSMEHIANNATMGSLGLERNCPTSLVLAISLSVLELFMGKKFCALIMQQRAYRLGGRVECIQNETACILSMAMFQVGD